MYRGSCSISAQTAQNESSVTRKVAINRSFSRGLAQTQPIKNGHPRGFFMTKNVKTGAISVLILLG